MFGSSFTRLAVAAASLAVALSAGAATASALPDLDPVINTTCNYSQVMAALNAEDPVAAGQVNGSPASQIYLRGFLASPPGQRAEALQRMENNPNAQPYVQQYVGLVLQVANTCHNY